MLYAFLFLRTKLNLLFFLFSCRRMGADFFSVFGRLGWMGFLSLVAARRLFAPDTSAEAPTSSAKRRIGGGFFETIFHHKKKHEVRRPCCCALSCLLDAPPLACLSKFHLYRTQQCFAGCPMFFLSSCSFRIFLRDSSNLLANCPML